MKISKHFSLALAASLMLVAGCSALPGLRVLTGQDSPQAAADQVVELTDLVMADKSGSTDPSLLAAADRIEQANGGTVDIIQIGKDNAKDIFNVDLLWRPDNIDSNTTIAQYVDTLRRLVEVTWQGTMQASQGSDMLDIHILLPVPIDTLDNGPSFAAVVYATMDISRSDAIAYLSHRPTSLNDFVDLIAQGKMQYSELQNGQTPQYYSGQPNHPVFMLAQMQAQAASQQSQQSSQSGQ